MRYRVILHDNSKVWHTEYHVAHMLAEEFHWVWSRCIDVIRRNYDEATESVRLIDTDRETAEYYVNKINGLKCNWYNASMEVIR